MKHFFLTVAFNAILQMILVFAVSVTLPWKCQLYCGVIEIMVACGSLPCVRFSRFSCLAGRAAGFAELLSGCLLLLQTPLVVSSFPPDSLLLAPRASCGPQRHSPNQGMILCPQPCLSTPALICCHGGGNGLVESEWHGIIISFLHLSLHLGFLTTPLMILLILKQGQQCT